MTETAKQPNKLIAALKENKDKIRTKVLVVGGTVAALAVAGYLAYTKTNEKQIDIYVIEPSESSDSDDSDTSSNED